MSKDQVREALRDAKALVVLLDEEFPEAAQTAERIVATLAALSALAAAPEVDRVRWQCSGCKFAFPGPWQKVCPSCGRSDYWSGSVDPNATRWVGAATQPPAPEPAAPSGASLCPVCGPNFIGRCPHTPAAPSGEAQPVCRRCDDLHVMETADGRSLMCVYCPRPCEKCRAGGNGAYCEQTPCGCACHRKPAPTPEAAQAPTREPLDDAELTDAANMRPSYFRQQLLLGEARRARAELAKVRGELERWKLRVEVEKKNRDAAIERATAAEQRIGEARALIHDSPTSEVLMRLDSILATAGEESKP